MRGEIKLIGGCGKNFFNIVIIEDNPIFKEGFNFFFNYLKETVKYKIISETDVLNNIERSTDLIIIGYSISFHQAIDILNVAKNLHPSLKIILSTTNISLHEIQLSKHLGLAGIIKSHFEIEMLIKMLLSLRNDKSGTFFEIGSFIRKKVIPIQTINSDLYSHKLTNRENEILKFISFGYTSKRIGEILFISERTVEVHRKNIRNKLNLKTNFELIHFIANAPHNTI